MASPQSDELGVPQQFANVPPDISAGAGHLRLVVQELKTDIKDIKDHRHSDFVHMVELYGAGFLLLAGMLVSAYFVIDSKFEKLGEKVDRMSTSSTRIDTKLEDLLARIPPVQAPAPRPQGR